jgi:tRNA(adenine34) deaminase
MDEHEAMRLALEEADLAVEHNDVPVGAVVLDAQGQLLARAHNRREVDDDPTAHAEILALRQAAQRCGHWQLNHCTLVVTLEPCPMCAGALVNARIARLVFGAHDPKAGAIESLYALAGDPRLNHRLEWQAGVEREAAVRRLQAFFRKLRDAGKK